MFLRGVRHLQIVLLMAGLISLAACQDDRGPVSITSHDPDLQIQAIKLDVSQGNKADIPVMVQELGNDDSAIRFYAIQGLWRLTHDDFGYYYYQDDDQRAPAMKRWQNWLKATYPKAGLSS